MSQIETFGQALARLMQNRDCTAKELTNRMHIKSSNTIARLLADKSSPNKIRTFCDDLLRENPLQLVEYEKGQLREAMAVSMIGTDTYTANKHMLYYLQERPQTPSCICKQAFGEGGMFITTLDELLQSYTEFQSVSIMLNNCAMGGVTRAIKKLLEHNGNLNIKIEHYVNVNEDRAEVANSFLSLLDVMGHPDYSFFFSPHRNNGGNDFYNVYSNIMVALKCDHAGNKFTDFITFHTKDSFTVLYQIPGDATYQFNFYQFHALRMQHNPATVIHSNRFNLEGMLDYNERLLEMDQSRPLISIRPDISLCMVPPEIMRSVLESLYQKSDHFYEEYLQVVNQRHQIFSGSGKWQRYLFSKSGIYHFLRQGKSKANVFGLRDLTLLESRKVIERILEIGHSVPNISFHLLKNELRYNNIAYLLYGNDTLFIDNYPGFRNYDPAKSCNSCWVQAPYITENFASFAENNLIPNYTYSNKETLEFLESLL